jgi:hypothetical protein
MKKLALLTFGEDACAGLSRLRSSSLRIAQVGSLCVSPPRAPSAHRSANGADAADHRPSRTSLGPGVSNRARSTAIFFRKSFRRWESLVSVEAFDGLPLPIYSGPTSQVQVSHPAVGRMCACYG